jgi:hypothetical protein
MAISGVTAVLSRSQAQLENAPKTRKIPLLRQPSGAMMMIPTGTIFGMRFGLPLSRATGVLDRN